MNLRIEALRDMKEDLMIRNSKVSGEIEVKEYQLLVPILEYNYNDINREILVEPVNVPVRQ